MNWAQMRERCPSACFVGIAVLRDHKLAFTRRSVKRGCGVADVVSAGGARVWGVVYEIDDVDVDDLNASEGFTAGRRKNSYLRRECAVFLNGEGQLPITVSAYFGEPQPNPPLPSAAYKDVILAGARHWHLPEDYLRELEQIEIGE